MQLFNYLPKLNSNLKILDFSRNYKKKVKKWISTNIL